MKVALVHDYIKEYGGAERVLEALHEIYPQADVYTTVYLPDYLGPHKKRFANWKIHTSFLQHLPFKQKLISPIRLVSPLAFTSFDFSQYDVIITSATGAYFPNSIRVHRKQQSANNNASRSALRATQMLISYCHTPPRYLYGYATAREWKKNKLFNILGETANHFLRMVDFNSSKNVDYFIANSEEVKQRIEKFYRRDATVIYPPAISSRVHEALRAGPTVDVAERTALSAKRGDYYLAGGRLARPKHIDLIVEACLELKLPLKVFGKSFAGYGEELEQMANGKWQIVNGEKKPLIEFLGEVSDEEKADLMKHAKAFVFASEDEDFGIVPVEAMGHGLPVIAYKSGGVKETVIDGKTGVFFDDLKVESLKKAIKQFNNITISSYDCIKQAEKFSKERFIKEIYDFVNSKLKMQNSKSQLKS